MSESGQQETAGRRRKKSPDAFRTISEVADVLDVPQHVLRFWESKFTQVRPLKRGGGRRYYRPEDIDLLRGIRALLYDDGYTIKGVQKLLKENGAKSVIETGRAPGAPNAAVAAARSVAQLKAAEAEEERAAEDGNGGLNADQRRLIATAIDTLETLRDELRTARAAAGVAGDGDNDGKT